MDGLGAAGRVGGLGIGRTWCFFCTGADAVGGSPLGITWLGLAMSAGLAIVLTAAQILPVIEFLQQTVRAGFAGTHDVYRFSIEPFRLVELVWPNVMGVQFDGNTHWRDVVETPGKPAGQLGAVDVPGGDDSDAGVGRACRAARSAVARLADGAGDGEPPGQSGAVHKPHLDGTDPGGHVALAVAAGTAGQGRPARSRRHPRSGPMGFSAMATAACTGG